MKNKFIKPLTLAVALLFVFAACSSNSAPQYESARSPAGGFSTSANKSLAPEVAPTMPYYEYAADEYLSEAEIPGINPSTGGGGDEFGAAPANFERKIVRNAEITAETMDFDAASKSVEDAVKQYGGFISDRSVGGNSYYRYSDVSERTLWVSARIPSERLDEFLESVGDLINVTYRSEYSEDMSDVYFDSESRMNALLIQEERYLSILKGATEVSDIITIEAALSDLRYQIERLKGSLNRIDDRVSFSTVNINLREVSQYNIIAASPKNFGEKLVLAFSSSLSRLGRTAENTLLSAIENGPSFLFNLLLIFVVYKIITRFVPALKISALRSSIFSRKIAVKTETRTKTTVEQDKKDIDVM